MPEHGNSHDGEANTASQVHRKVPELVERGVVRHNPPPPPRVPVSSIDPQAAYGVPDDGADYLALGQAASSSGGSEPGGVGDSVSPFTPRTQATYSMTSTSDDEQFSPPIYTRDRRGRNGEFDERGMVL